MFYTDRWLFVHIPRTGGTNLRINAVEQRNATLAYDHPLAKHNPIWTVILPWPRTSYAIVRNPYERYASLWAQLVEQGRTKCSFKDFVEFESFNDASFYHDAKWDPDLFHWRLNLPQAGYIDSRTRTLKFEGNLEPLEYWTGVKFLQTKHHANSSNDYENLYDSHLMKMVYKRFEIDFDTFGYTKQWK